jgi:hypothetical protein
MRSSMRLLTPVFASRTEAIVRLKGGNRSTAEGWMLFAERANGNSSGVGYHVVHQSLVSYSSHCRDGADVLDAT